MRRNHKSLILLRWWTVSVVGLQADGNVWSAVNLWSSSSHCLYYSLLTIAVCCRCKPLFHQKIFWFPLFFFLYTNYSHYLFLRWGHKVAVLWVLWLLLLLLISINCFFSFFVFFFIYSTSFDRWLPKLLFRFDRNRIYNAVL